MKLNFAALMVAAHISFSAFPIYAQENKNCETLTNADSPNAKRINQLLKGKQFVVLDDELNDKKRRYSKGEYSDLELFMDITTAVKNDVTLEPLLAEWVAAMPKSMFARILKAKNHISIGYSKRGTEIASKTTEEQFRSLATELQKATVELKVAQEIDPKSALPAAAMIEITRSNSGAEVTREIVTKAEKNDTANLAVRYYAIAALSPRWGGAFEDLDAILDRANKDQLNSKKIRLLKYQVEMEKANYFETITKENDKAISQYHVATQICSGSQPWLRIVSLSWGKRDWKSVKDSATQVINEDSKHTQALKARSWANETLGLMAEAVNDYQILADQGEATALSKLGYFYLIGKGVPKDYPRARLLLTSAAAKGDIGAQTNLDWMDKYAGGK